MKGTTLRALGLNIGDVDARVLLDEGFDCSGYGLTKAGTRKLALLRTFINEYREDLSKEPGKCIRNSSDAAALMADSLRGLDHEELWVAFLNRANIVIDTVRMTTGSMTSTVIENTRILRTAILKKASGVILYHNHPSGSPLPGRSDIKSTESLKKVLDLLELSLLDHIIIADSRWYSFADESVTEFEK